jgi:hypothetical protein
VEQLGVAGPGAAAGVGLSGAGESGVWCGLGADLGADQSGERVDGDGWTIERPVDAVCVDGSVEPVIRQ